MKRKYLFALMLIPLIVLTGCPALNQLLSGEKPGSGQENQVEKPEFSPAAGTYSTAQTVSITSQTADASIRYTTDGTDPSETKGTPYSSPVLISATTTIKAIAYKEGMTASEIASGSYTINIPTGTTFSGKVIDSVTGTGIAGVQVEFGSSKTSTDSSGKFSMTVSQQTETLGIYKVEQPIKYISKLFGNVTINPGDSQNKTIILDPNDTGSYETHNLSGNIYLSGGTEISDGSFVDLYIYNSNKGISYLSATYSSESGGYSVDSATFGPDCLIAVFVYDPSHSLLFSYYVKGIDFSTDITENFTQPLTGYTDVSVTNGQDNDTYSCYLDTPTYGYVRTSDSITYSGSSNVVSIYNPDSYNFFWQNQRLDSAWTGGEETGQLQYFYSTGSESFASSVALPSLPASYTIADTAFDNTLGYSQTSNILSIQAPLSGAAGYYLVLNDSSSGNQDGVFFISGTSITIPDGLASYLEEKSYNITIYPMNADINLNKACIFPTSGAAPYYENMQIEIALYSNSTNSGFTF
ncbi:MAG: hypothetical protein GXP33_09145 [Spirochaetes bacterium]|nr:hypothetical protein [Spirochaetota bacterium]